MYLVHKPTALRECCILVIKKTEQNKTPSSSFVNRDILIPKTGIGRFLRCPPLPLHLRQRLEVFYLLAVPQFRDTSFFQYYGLADLLGMIYKQIILLIFRAQQNNLAM